MNKRRKLLLNIACGLLMPKIALSGTTLWDRNVTKKLSWGNFQTQMTALSERNLSDVFTQQHQIETGLHLLQQLDIHSSEFISAVTNSYESGNRYWLWQRLMKQHNINGGILNIDNEQLVQLHDHPGAMGMVRIISGKAEVWQYDEITHPKQNTKQMSELSLVSRKILYPGDTAVLTPDKGNIHALRSVTKECRMLDFFIPPYQLSQRSWFEPLAKNWFDKDKISCRKSPHKTDSNA